jgi:signal peptidase I
MSDNDYNDLDSFLTDSDTADENTVPDTVGQGANEKTKKTRMEIFDWLQCVISAVICGIFIFVFVGRTIGVDGKSMLQTLHHNDRVVMSNLFFTPKNGDIIIFRSPSETFGKTPLVKRVIAIAGQTVDIDFNNGDVIVDGVILNEPYINEPTRSRLDFVGPMEVPEGYVFVLGDNRNNSSDSRASSVGLVDTRYILGKVLFVLIPGADKDTPRDWSRVGFVKH